MSDGPSATTLSLYSWATINAQTADAEANWQWPRQIIARRANPICEMEKAALNRRNMLAAGPAAKSLSPENGSQHISMASRDVINILTTLDKVSVQVPGQCKTVSDA